MVITRTPFRISFFGGGTDYPAWFDNFGGGAVLSTTIDKYCYLTCRYLPPFFEKKSRIVWSKVEIVNHPDEVEHPAVREALKFLDINKGIGIHYDGDLPHRSGMGSSSSFTVGLLHALQVLRGVSVTKKQLALDAIHLEQEKMKESVGMQDQAAAAYGGFNRINFGGEDRIHVQPISISPEGKAELEGNLLLFFTGISRTASEIAKKQIVSTPKKEKELRRMLVLVDEAENTLRRADGDSRVLDDFGRLLHETWLLKRGLTDAISNSHIDEIYERARRAGALGGKLLGAGGGGFILFYARPEVQDKVKNALSGILHVPFHFEEEGSKVIYTDGS